MLRGNWKCFLGFHKWVEDKTPTNGCLWRFCDCCGGRQQRYKCGASDTWQWRWF